MVSLIFTFQHNYPGSSDCVPGLKTCMEHVLCVFLHAFFSSPMSARLCVCVCVYSPVLKVRVRVEMKSISFWKSPTWPKSCPPVWERRMGRGTARRVQHCRPLKSLVVSKCVLKESFRYAELRVLWAVLKESQLHKSSLLLRKPFGG